VKGGKSIKVVIPERSKYESLTVNAGHQRATFEAQNAASRPMSTPIERVPNRRSVLRLVSQKARIAVRGVPSKCRSGAG
jgi:hypothetical protein